MEQAEERPRLPGAGANALFLGAAAIAVVLDQFTKAIAAGLIERGDQWPEGWAVRFVHVTNSGAAFGLLEGQTLFLIVTSLMAIVAIGFYCFFPPAEHNLVRIALGLLLGGAIGNLIDRVAAGEVIDFIKFPNWPAFNVADSSITIGVTMLIIFSLFAESPKPAQNDEQSRPDG